MSTTGIVPYKTTEGHDELARRTRRLGQRHRTMLLLVDGRRSVDQVLALALAAGVGEHHFRELFDAGLIALPEGAATAATQPVPLDEPSLVEQVRADAAADAHVDLPMEDAVPDMPSAVTAPALPEVAAPVLPEVAAPRPAAVAATPRLPEAPVRTLHAGNAPTLHELAPLPLAEGPPAVGPAADRSAAPPLPADPQFHDPLMPPPAVDGPLEEAREILIRAVRAEAPVAGQLTLLKLKHASDRADLEGLLDEVEQRIARPRKMVAAAHTLRHVRSLLCMPPSTAFTMY